MAKHLPSVWHRLFLDESGLFRLMNESFSDFPDVGFDISPSVGKTDVYERDDNVIYEMELPGVGKDEVEIKIDQGRLTVFGEAKSEAKRSSRRTTSGLGGAMGASTGAFPCLPTSRIDRRSAHH